MEEKNIKSKQHKLSVALRIATVVLAGTGAFAYTMLHTFMRAIPYLTSDEMWKVFDGKMQQKVLSVETWNTLMRGNTFLSMVVFALVLVFFGCFQRICKEIGNDNSFSKENVKNFNVMMGLSTEIAVIYVLRIVIYVSRCLMASYPRAAFIIGVLYLVFAIGFITLAFMCRTLSRLVYNAYEMKNENDLTI